MNTQDYPWRDNWKEYYESRLRGTRLVEDKKRAYLTYDYVLREGYILSFSMSENAAMPNSLDFNFSMFITKEVNLNPNFQEVSDSIIATERATELANDAASAWSKLKSISKMSNGNIYDAVDGYRELIGKEAFSAQIGMPKKIPMENWAHGTVESSQA